METGMLISASSTLPGIIIRLARTDAFLIRPLQILPFYHYTFFTFNFPYMVFCVYLSIKLYLSFNRTRKPLYWWTKTLPFSGQSFHMTNRQEMVKLLWLPHQDWNQWSVEFHKNWYIFFFLPFSSWASRNHCDCPWYQRGDCNRHCFDLLQV